MYTAVRTIQSCVAVYEIYTSLFRCITISSSLFRHPATLLAHPNINHSQTHPHGGHFRRPPILTFLKWESRFQASSWRPDLKSSRNRVLDLYQGSRLTLPVPSLPQVFAFPFSRGSGSVNICVLLGCAAMLFIGKQI